MFRNPREDATLQVTGIVLPSTGRPPTPPSDTRSSPYFQQSTPPVSKAMNTSQIRTTPGSGTDQPFVPGGRPASKPTSTRKPFSRPNQSILKFFGKTAYNSATTRDANEDLFFEEAAKHKNDIPESDTVDSDDENFVEDLSIHHQTFRYNESNGVVKRRRIGSKEAGVPVRASSPRRTVSNEVVASPKTSIGEDSNPRASLQKSIRQRGGFVDDSSDEEDHEAEVTQHRTVESANSKGNSMSDSLSEGMRSPVVASGQSLISKVPVKPPHEDLIVDDYAGQPEIFNPFPSLSREEISMLAVEDFDKEDDFENDEFFEQGEEFMERQWMQEQREMEAGLDEDSKSESGTDGIMTPIHMSESDARLEMPQFVATCPICSGSLKDLTEAQASSHVNACLDGSAPALPMIEGPNIVEGDETRLPKDETFTSGPASKRFQRAAIARPGQTNPFSFGERAKAKDSAFSRLMSGHAEDTAWAEAASNEAQSRGKPAYQRTCPFYKIMPGFYIAVDAFRYGKVEGQNAYFLSHFHSDHYIGLTSSWCHGPIYASKVTTNLIRQQLRVDSKWLVSLEFEKKSEVPHTKGVFVTMLPANHCPGSSLFLFEKEIGKNKDRSPKLNRILHCGDFRACPAHVNHPLLKPEVVDTVTGATKHQLIDTCYLDTTYLTPKYSFPCQSDVIDACAQMCVSLANEVVDSNDGWEKTKLAKTGSAMRKFLDEGESSIIKQNANEEEQDIKPKSRGRLLVVIGTYSIGKERICLGIAKALGSKIFAPPAKMKICRCLEDEELNSLLTSNPLEAQVHMQTLMEIRAETLHDYLVTYKGHFARVVGFRPTGWSYRPPTSRSTENPAVGTVLNSEGWKSRFTMKDLVPQRGSTKESNCFGVPYSEHSSFRELTMFCCALRIGRVVPTVNVGSSKSREKMKGWIEKWEAEKKKNGLFKVEVGEDGWGSGDGSLHYGV